MKVLGLETSCDETGLAIFDSEQITSDNKGLLGQVLYSQIELHALYGGVVPELASRDHIRKLVPLFNELLEQCNITKDEIDAVAYTKGPGLIVAQLSLWVKYSSDWYSPYGRAFISAAHGCESASVSICLLTGFWRSYFTDCRTRYRTI